MVDSNKHFGFFVAGTLVAAALVLALAPGAEADDGYVPATTQSHDGDVCIHQLQPDAHQVPCLVAAWLPDSPGDEAEVCVAVPDVVSGFDETCYNTETSQASYDVCLPSPDPHKRQVCIASMWVPDVPSLCYREGPHGEEKCIT